MTRLILRAAVAAALLALCGVSAAHANPDIHLVWPSDHTTTPTTLSCGGTANHWAQIRVVYTSNGCLEGLQEVSVADDMGHQGPMSDYGPFADTFDPASLPCGEFPNAAGDWSVDWMATISCGPYAWHNNSHTISATVSYYVVTYSNPETGEEWREYYTATNSQAFTFSKLLVTNTTGAPHERVIKWDPATMQSVTLSCSLAAAGHWNGQGVIYEIRHPETHALIRSVTRDATVPGSDSWAWDGRDDLGQPVERGVYVYHIYTPTNSGGQDDSEKSWLLGLDAASQELIAYNDQTRAATVRVSYTLSDIFYSIPATSCQVVAIDPEFQERVSAAAPTALGEQSVDVNVTLDKAGDWFFVVCPIDDGSTRHRAHANHPALQRGVTRFVNIDVDVDSDNTNAYDPPDRSAAEDTIEDNAGLPGIIIYTNDGDIDLDQVPSFADGYNLDGGSGSDDLDGEPMWPLVVDLVGLSPTQAVVKFTYNASHPLGLTRTGDPGSYTYTPAPGNLRIWTKNGPVTRNGASVLSGGDYVPTGTAIPSTQLGLSQGTATLFLEGVAQSETEGDQRILVEVDPDGEGPSGFQFADAVRVTVGSLGSDPTMEATCSGRVSGTAQICWARGTDWPYGLSGLEMYIGDEEDVFGTRVARRTWPPLIGPWMYWLKVRLDTTHFADGSTIVLRTHAWNLKGVERWHILRAEAYNKAYVLGNQALDFGDSARQAVAACMGGMNHTVTTSIEHNNVTIFNNIQQHTVFYAWTHGQVLPTPAFQDCLGYPGEQGWVTYSMVQDRVEAKPPSFPPYNLVYLSACKCAGELSQPSDVLATAFGITAQSVNRVFLGWQGAPNDTAHNRDWDQALFTQLQAGMTLYQAIAWANDANNVGPPDVEPGSQLRIIGDGNTKIHGVYGGLPVQWYLDLSPPI